ncbi:MAG TPA: hypothetical protein VH105_07955 [Burkholderiales bacterium]|jgi:ElaB/YqjD/DUF883 family membrane-anchored ribosome-binding protein|nr:hypothetical protein [Burkholderiales bacterium]
MSSKNIASPTEAISGAVDDVKSSFGNVAQSIAGAFDQRKAAAAEQFDAGRAAVTDYARSNPMRTIGVAALAGIALGVLFFRR